MPWKECSVVDERLRFVAQLLDGEAMSEVCRAFGISRKTGYKIFEAPARSIPQRRVVDARGARLNSRSGASDANSMAGGLWEWLAAGRHRYVAAGRKGHPSRSLSAASRCSRLPIAATICTAF